MTPRRRTSAHYDELLTALGKADVKTIEKLARLAWRRAASASTGPDGYRAGTSFADGGSTSGAVSNPTADAALRRSESGRDPDPVSRAVATVFSVLPGLVAALDTITGQLAAIDKLNPTVIVPGCAHLANFGAYEPVHRKGPYCRWVTDFKARNNRLPTREEVEAHLEGKRVQ